MSIASARNELLGGGGAKTIIYRFCEITKCVQKKTKNQGKFSEGLKSGNNLMYNIETAVPTFKYHYSACREVYVVILSGYLEKSTWFTLRFFDIEIMKEKILEKNHRRRGVVGVFLF